MVGADGRLGQVVVPLLVEAGVAVTGLSPQWSHACVADRVVTGDATEVDDVAAALEDVDAVVHLGALSHPDAGEPYSVYRINTDSTFNVLSQAAERGVDRAVIASSINASGVPMNHHRSVLPAYYPIDEDLPAQLDDWYSLSKASDELTARMVASRWAMTVVAIRFPLLTSPEDLAGAARGAGLQEAREGYSHLDWRDAAAVLLRGLLAGVRGAVVVGVSAPQTYMGQDTASLLAEHAPEVPIRRPIEGRAVAVDTTRARTLLGFTPRWSSMSPLI